MGKVLSSTVLLAVVFLTACSSSSDISSRAAAKLHSGSIVIVMPQEYVLFTTRQYNDAPIPVSGSVSDIMIMGALSSLLGYVAASQRYYPTQNKSYIKELKTISLRRKILSLARKTSMQVAWLGDPSTVKEYDKLPRGVSARSIAEASNHDAVVFVRPHIYFSYDLRNLFVVLHVEAFARGRSEATLIGDDKLVRTESMDDAKTKGEEAKLRLACLNRQRPQAARKACAQLWFAHDAFFLRSALMLDMKYLEKDLSDYLNGKQDSFAKSG